jgi:hypothetical protein
LCSTVSLSFAVAVSLRTVYLLQKSLKIKISCN